MVVENKGRESTWYGGSLLFTDALSPPAGLGAGVKID